MMTVLTRKGDNACFTLFSMSYLLDEHSESFSVILNRTKKVKRTYPYNTQYDTLLLVSAHTQ